jgi:hypothetical protein
MAVLHVYGEIVRSEVLVAVNMKMAVFLNVAPCTLVEIYQHFDPEGGMSRFFRKFNTFLSVHLASHPRRQKY